MNRLLCSHREFNETFPLTGMDVTSFFPADWIFTTKAIDTFLSSKIHEDDVKREIQTANVNLPPEILQVFASSQIFHDHKPLKSKQQSQQPATFSIGTSKIDKSKLEQINEEGSNKLLQRLEQGNGWRWWLLEEKYFFLFFYFHRRTAGRLTNEGNRSIYLFYFYFILQCEAQFF